MIQETYQSELQTHHQTAVMLYESAAALKISTKDEAEMASGSLQKVKALSKTLDDRRKEITKPMDEAKKSVMALFKKPMDILENAERAFKKALLDFQMAEERKLEAARAAAEMERLKEEQRLIAEQKKLTKNTTVENIDRIREIVEAKQEIADERKAEERQIEEQKKVEGVSVREVWKFEITDINLVPREYMIPDEKELQKFAQVYKGQGSMSGVRFYSEKIIASRWLI